MKLKKILITLGILTALAMGALYAYANEGAPIPLCQPNHCHGPQCTGG